MLFTQDVIQTVSLWYCSNKNHKYQNHHFVVFWDRKAAVILLSLNHIMQLTGMQQLQYPFVVKQVHIIPLKFILVWT